MNDRERNIVGSLEVLPVESIEFGQAFRGYLERHREWRDVSMDGLLLPFITTSRLILKNRFTQPDAFRRLVDAVGACEVLEAFDAKRLDFALEDIEDFGDVFDLSVDRMAAEVAQEHCQTCDSCRTRIAAESEIEATVRTVSAVYNAERPPSTES